MNEAVNAYDKKARTYSEWVWFEDNVALLEGQAVCYNWDYYSGTDTTHLLSDARRRNRVETCSTTNAQYFAGVCARGYSANSTGRLIEIYKPGSVCNVLLGLNQTEVIGVGILTFDVTTGFVGEFRYAGIPGAGSVVPMQRVTTTSARAVCLAELQIGPPSGGVQVSAMAATGAITGVMVGGTTYFAGGAIASGHNTLAIADGVTYGIRKQLIIVADVTSYNFTITVTTGIGHDNDALDTFTYTDAGDHDGAAVTLKWANGAWNVDGLNAKAGAALA